jgi:hypothetical protein
MPRIPDRPAPETSAGPSPPMAGRGVDIKLRGAGGGSWHSQPGATWKRLIPDAEHARTPGGAGLAGRRDGRHLQQEIEYFGASCRSGTWSRSRRSARRRVQTAWSAPTIQRNGRAARQRSGSSQFFTRWKMSSCGIRRGRFGRCAAQHRRYNPIAHGSKQDHRAIAGTGGRGQLRPIALWVAAVLSQQRDFLRPAQPAVREDDLNQDLEQMLRSEVLTRPGRPGRSRGPWRLLAWLAKSADPGPGDGAAVSVLYAAAAPRNGRTE